MLYAVDLRYIILVQSLTGERSVVYCCKCITTSLHRLVVDKAMLCLVDGTQCSVTESLQQPKENVSVQTCVLVY